MIAKTLATWTVAPQGPYRCWVAPVLLDQGFTLSGDALYQAVRNGHAEVVKQGPHRVVYRLPLSSGVTVYVKHNLVPDSRAWLRQLVRPSKARMEMGRALAVAACGVPTVEPLGLAECQTPFGAGDSYLITRGLDDTIPLNSFLVKPLADMPEPRRTRVRQRLAKALGRLVASMHAAGIRHDDLHAANVLVRLSASDEPLLFLVDLSAVRVGPALAWPTARDNLVLFTRWFIPRASRADRLRFWRAYYQARGLGQWPRGRRGDREHLVLGADLEHRAWDSALAFWKSRDRRPLGNNRYYRRVRGPAAAGHVVTDLDRNLVKALLADPDAPFEQPGTRFIKNSRGSLVAEVFFPQAGKLRPLIFKRFNATHWARPWLSLLRPSAALRSWVLGHGFRERCLPTARPLAMLRRIGPGGAPHCYLLAEKVENAVDLHGFLAHLADLPAALARRRMRLGLETLARLVRYLHHCQLDHRDLKASNLLILRELECQDSPFAPLGQEPAGAALHSLLPLPASSAWFIDLVGVTRHARLSRSRRIRNLTRLHASFHQSQCLTRSDKLRFLRSYLLWNLKGSGGWKVWWRAIARATGQKVALNARRGRVLA